MAFQFSPKIVTDGLVLYLDAANTRSYPGTGELWTDLSRMGYTASLFNGPVFSSLDNGSILFDGLDDFGAISTNRQNLDISGNLTVEAFSYPTSFSNQGNIVSKYNPGYRIRFQSNGSFWMYSNGNSLTSSVNYVTNQWYHTVAVFSSSGLRMYVNNVLVGSNSTPFSPSYVNNSFIIGAYSPTLERFSGRISNIKLYNRALSVSEINQNYMATKSRFGL